MSLLSARCLVLTLRHMTTLRLTSLATISALALAAACGPNQEHVRADSAAAALSAQQTQLAMQLAAQKDSLTRVVLQADDFIMHIDSSMSKVKGLPKGKKSTQTLDPLARQIENRKARDGARGCARRARAGDGRGAAELEKANKLNVALREQLATDSAMIADLNATIQRQTATIEALSVRIDSLKSAQEVLATTLATRRDGAQQGVLRHRPRGRTGEAAA